MTRKEEIIILIEYLKDDVILKSQRHNNLLSETIVKNGKLIESYEIELDELKNE